MIGFASSLQLANHNEGKVYWMRLENLGDVSYTGLIRIGGHQVKAIVDTGSFELLVFGKNCTMCGSPEHLYDGSKSPQHHSTGFVGSHSYGSGSTTSVETQDQMQIGALKIPTQFFWEVVDANMPILAEDSFQAILGVGPPSSIISFAENEAVEVHKELKEYKKSGKKVTGQVQQIVDHYDNAVTHAKNATTVAENLGMENMAVCLNKGSGSHGYYIWNDRRITQMASKFTEIAVSGDIYWSANMTNVKIGAAPIGEENVSKAMKRASKAKSVGCHGQNCSAVIDTGTSLIVAPTEAAEKVFDAMRDWIEAGGTCDDLSKLPDLEFNLNGKSFSLPPEAYVGVMEGELAEDMRSFMPHLYHKEHQRLYESVGCQPLIMTMDADSQFGPLWILGMPFFRKYYTNFKFVNHIGKLSMPVATTMSFSVADSKCRPGHSPEEDVRRTSLVEKRSTQLRVDASKLRINYLARKVHAKGAHMLTKTKVRI
jgi:cathepsin D